MNQCNAFLQPQLPELDLSFIIAGPYPQTKRPTAIILFWSENNLDSYRTRTTTIMNHSKLNRGCSNIASVITTAIAKADWNAMDANYEAVSTHRHHWPYSRTPATCRLPTAHDLAAASSCLISRCKMSKEDAFINHVNRSSS
jgi:hypothetical protein